MAGNRPAFIGGSGLLVTTAVVLAISVLVGFQTDYGYVYLMTLVFAIAITIAEQWLLKNLLSGYTTGISYTYNSKSGLSRVEKEKIGSVGYIWTLWDFPSTAAQLSVFATTYWTSYDADDSNDARDSSDVYSLAAWCISGVLLTYSVFARIVTLEQCVLGIAGGTLLGTQAYRISKSIETS